MNTLEGVIRLIQGAHVRNGAASDRACPERLCPRRAGRSRMGGRLERSRLQSAGAKAASPFPRSFFHPARIVRALRRGAALPARLLVFLRCGREDGPCRGLDLDVVRDNYAAFAKALPDTRVFYAVKANPDPKILELLAELGSCFDTASVAEIEDVLAAGASADMISFGN